MPITYTNLHTFLLKTILKAKTLMDINQTTTIDSLIMAALSTLTPSQLTTLTTTLSTIFHHHRRRLASLLTSPALFTHTLNHLYSLSLPQKSLLIARHLLSFLYLFNPPSHPPRYRLRDLDSVLLLLFFCEVRQSNPSSLETPAVYWRGILADYCSDTMLNLSGFPVSSTEALGIFIDIVVKCRKFVTSKGCGGGSGEVAASVAAVVALPSVEVKKGGADVECTICKDELAEGRDVCELPCQHLFHWMCVLPWLSQRNTCPCCRFRLPTDDVYGEIERLWDVIVKLGLQISDSVDEPSDVYL